MTITRKEACEAYKERWQRRYLSERQWQEALNLLYEGKGPAQIVRELGLDAKCKRSLARHAQKHRSYIAFMRGVRLKDKRLQMGATLSEAWRALIEKIFAIATDESTRPGIRVKAAMVAQKEMADLQRLAQAAVEEFKREEGEAGGVGDVEAMVRRIASDVYGVRCEGNGNN